MENTLPVGSFVKCKWLDIVVSGGWAKEEQIDQTWEKPAHCVTIGWLAVSNEKYVSIASTKSGSEYNQYIVIPAGVIEELKLLSEVE